MPTRSLVQALEGMEFPCDRERVIEYARRNEASPRSLDSLAALPARQFRDMTELFSALPGKREMGRRRRATVVHVGAPQPASPPEPAEGVDEDAAEGGRLEAGRDEPEETASPPLAAPAPPELANLAMQWWRLGAEIWPEWVRLSQRLWFPWVR